MKPAVWVSSSRRVIGLVAVPSAAASQRSPFRFSYAPSATVITDQIDPLQSEGQALAEKLKQAGVKVDAHNYDGVTHEFFGMGLVVAKAKQAEDVAVADLKKSFGSK